MNSTNKLEVSARDCFDAADSLAYGDVFFEAIKPSSKLEPWTFTDVRRQLESVASSFGVEHPGDDPATVQHILGSLQDVSTKMGLTFVIVGTQMPPGEQVTGSIDDYVLSDDPEFVHPMIPGFVALYSDWPDACCGYIRDEAPSQARMVHWMTSTYDILDDFLCLWSQFVKLPHVEAQESYPACA